VTTLVVCTEEGAVSFVGIIANPASGKDVRRVASHAIAANNYQKTNIVRRLLVALAALNVGRVEIMPDPFGIGLRALEGLARQPDIQAITSLIDMPVTGGEADTLHAARHLCETGAGCLIVLGGDGTCRVAAKGCGGVPMLPISTGTNNVVPYFVEGTAAGLAAAYVARRPDTPRERLCYRHKRLVVAVNRDRTDQALVDVALLASRFTGSRAVWDAGELRQVFVTRAGPFNIGISSVVGVLHPVGRDHPGGAMAGVAAGPGAGRRVVAPIAPGKLAPIDVAGVLPMQPGIAYPVLDERPAVLSLDGERELALYAGDRATVTLELDGPWIVDVERALLLAVEEGVFAP
jgi:predicted polyphosphate/ATP-dependent NAD kinase